MRVTGTARLLASGIVGLTAAWLAAPLGAMATNPGAGEVASSHLSSMLERSTEWTAQALGYLAENGLLTHEELIRPPSQAVMAALKRASSRMEQGEQIPAPVQAVLFHLLLSYADEMEGMPRPPSGDELEPDQMGRSMPGHGTFEHDEEEEHGLEWKGFIDYRFNSNKDEGGSTFSLPHVSLEIEGQVTPLDDICVEIEWEEGGIEGGEDGGAVEIERARIDHQLTEGLKLRAGALIIPVGHLGMHHEPYEITGASQPIMAEGIIPAAWSELGVGLVSEPNDKVRIIALLSQGLEDSISDEGLREALPSWGEEEFSGKATTLNLQLEPSRELTVGGSWYQTSFSQGGRLDHLSAYLQWERHGYRILAEFARASISADNPDLPSWMWGWYLQGELPLPSLAWRQGTLPKLFARLGRVDTSSDPSLGRKRRLTLGLNFPLDQNLTLKLEAQRTWDQSLPSPQNRLLASLVMIF